MPSLESAPLLSTPDTHIFQETGPQVDVHALPRSDDEQLNVTYEIKRTVSEIRAGRWKRIALQFPDHMLLDAPRVFTALSRGLKQARKSRSQLPAARASADLELNSVEALLEDVETINTSEEAKDAEEERLYILADTSYGSCCVDEVAAEHADADVVVHYGRSCLSPTARLPVIYVFTKPSLDIVYVVSAFRHTYSNTEDKIILMADIPYASYIAEVAVELRHIGYTNIFETSIVHDTASPLPNRSVPDVVAKDAEALHEYHLFHISDPPPSLLLTLSSRVSSIHICPTGSDSAQNSSTPTLVSSLATLRRRYALLTSITTVPIFGILVNTLSVKNYMHILSHIKKVIAAAGKKSYTFVVGKVNAAKVANFAEVGGWVVIGCWESSLFDSKDFWKPVITPFELELALQGDAERVWTGQWRSDFQAILEEANHEDRSKGEVVIGNPEEEQAVSGNGDLNDDEGSEEESEPPEFDLRTGRYVSNSRPMGTVKTRASVKGKDSNVGNPSISQTLIKRVNGQLASIGGEVSPAVEYFRNKRSWRGLGSDINVSYDEENDGEGASMEQGRSGIARGYVVGESSVKR